MIRRTAAVLALLAPMLVQRAATAQSAKDLAAARKAFHEGEEAEAKGDNATALARFQAALAVKSTAQLHLRVGAVEEKLGRLRDALASYERGLALAAALPTVAKVAREQIDALKPRIPTVTVLVTTPPPGLVVTLDGDPLAVGALGTALPIDPGPHRLHAEAPGYRARDEAFDAMERGVTRTPLDLAPLADADATGPSKLPGALVVSGGAAALIAGGVLIALSVVKDGRVDDLCGGADRLFCPLSKKDAILSDVRTVNAMRFAGLGVGLAGLAGVAAGTALLVRASKSPPATGALVPVPLLGARAVGVGLSGRF